MLWSACIPTYQQGALTHPPKKIGLWEIDSALALAFMSLHVIDYFPFLLILDKQRVVSIQRGSQCVYWGDVEVLLSFHIICCSNRKRGELVGVTVMKE